MIVIIIVFKVLGRGTVEAVDIAAIKLTNKEKSYPQLRLRIGQGCSRGLINRKNSR